jgi:ABC-2 type transport system permease protein
MNVLSGYAQAMLATVKRDATIYISYRLRVASQILGMLFTLTIFFYVAKLVRPDAVGRHGSYYVFVVVGIVTMAILDSALNLSQLVRMELLAGNFERLLISPTGPVAGAVAMAVFPIAFAVVFAGFMLALAAGLYGLPIALAGIPLALLVAILGAVAFAAIGLLFVAGLLAYKSSMGATWVVAGLGLLGGIYFPIVLFPAWIRWVSDVQPLTPAVDLLRHLLVRTTSIQPVWLELLKLGGFVVVLTPVAGAVLWQAVKLGQRRGTIMEY